MKDDKTEAWLTKRHVTFTYVEDFPLADIDMAASLANQARISNPLDPETVERYKSDYAMGDDFPAVLLRKPSARSKKMVLLGGNHRVTAALQAGRAHHSAYIIDCEPELVPLLTYEDNRRHGMPPSRHERIRQGVHLVELGWTGKDAAVAVGVTQAEISNQRSVDKATRRAITLKVRQFPSLAQGAKLALAQVRSDPVFARAATLAASALLSVNEVKSMVASINSASSDEDALYRIGTLEEDHRHTMQRTHGGATGGKGRGRRGTGPTPFSKLGAALGSLMALEASDVPASAPTPEAKKEMRKRIATARRHLDDIDRLLKT